MKLIGIVFLVISGTSMGFVVSRRSQSHIDFLHSYIKLILDIKTEMKYNQQPLLRIFENYNADEYLFPLINKFLNFSKSHSFSLSWDMAFSNLNPNFGITKEEEKIIRNFASKLGQTDVENQINYLDYSISAIKPHLDIALENKKKNEKLPVILGLCISLIITAIII